MNVREETGGGADVLVQRHDCEGCQVEVVSQPGRDVVVRPRGGGTPLILVRLRHAANESPPWLSAAITRGVEHALGASASSAKDEGGGDLGDFREGWKRRGRELNALYAVISEISDGTPATSDGRATVFVDELRAWVGTMRAEYEEEDHELLDRIAAFLDERAAAAPPPSSVETGDGRELWLTRTSADAAWEETGFPDLAREDGRELIRVREVPAPSSTETTGADDGAS